MTIREIIRMGHPTLRKVAAPYPVEDIGGEGFVSLLTDMRETLLEAGGIGLAAPQIDIPVQIAIIEIKDDNTRYGRIPAMGFGVYVNPKVTVVDAEPGGFWEGCLSIPGMMGYVERPQHISVDYFDENARAQSIELKGFLATVFQHEFDHLQGKLYIDRITDFSRFSFEAEYIEHHQTDAPDPI